MNPGGLDAGDGRPAAGGGPGWRVSAAALGLYAACLSVATYPAVTHLTTRLPASLADPLMHLWVMKWYRACLREGRLPFFCPEIQFPAGAPLGNFSPMHLQGLLYLPLSAAVGNDVACYNLLWFGGFLFTGMATFLLARGATRENAAAWLAGLLAMLCGPMTVHAVAHLELIYAGGFSLFLAAWVAFVDRPGRGRLAAAAAALVLMTAGAAYFLVLAIPPAVLYVAWRADAARRDGTGALPWLRATAPWLAGFAAAALPPLALLFGSQFWAVAHGGSMRREWSQFAYYKATAWAYLVPTPMHALGRALPFDVYARYGFGGGRMGEGGSYLGVVAVALLVYAAARRVAFPRASFWWSALALLVVLSMGASCDVGAFEVPLPARWLWKYVPLYRLTRNPGRFNLLACQCGAVIAAAGLAQVLARVNGRGRRAAVVAALAAAATADLRVDAYHGSAVPPLPAFYRGTRGGGGGGGGGGPLTILEAPMTPSGAVDTLTSVAAFWQSTHRHRTSAGYSGHDNDRFNERAYHGSPFNAQWLNWEGFLADPLRENFGVVRGVGFRDYAWLYARFHGFDRVVLHEWAGAQGDFPARLDRLKAQMRPAFVSAGGGVTVYDPARLGPPARPVLVAAEGWLYGVGWRQWPFCPVAKAATLVACNPEPGRPVVFTLAAQAFRRPRRVRLTSGGDELASWVVAADAPGVYASPPLDLGPGVVGLELTSDGDDPASGRAAIAEGDARPFSLRALGVGLAPADGATAPAAFARGSNDTPARAGARR